MSIMDGSRYRRTRTRLWVSCAVVVALACAAVVVVSTQSNAAATMVELNASEAALSRAEPTRPMDCSTPSLAQAVSNSLASPRRSRLR